MEGPQTVYTREVLDHSACLARRELLLQHVTLWPHAHDGFQLLYCSECVVACVFSLPRPPIPPFLFWRPVAFYRAALVGLEITMKTRLALNSGFHLPLPTECWMKGVRHPALESDWLFFLIQIYVDVLPAHMPVY